MTNIGWHVFSGCKNLTAIHVAAGNAAYADAGGVLFDKKVHKLLVFPEGRTGDYTISDSVTEIGGSAFSGCSSLTGITIPDSVAEIGDCGFFGCKALARITCVGKIKLSASMFNEDLPLAFLRDFQDLLPNMADTLIQDIMESGAFWQQTSVKFQTELFLARQSKILIPAYAKSMQHPEKIGEEILTKLQGKPSVKICKGASAFMQLFAEQVDAPLLQRLYDALKNAKNGRKALEEAKANALLMKKMTGKNMISKDLPSAEQKVLNILLGEGRTPANVEDVFRKYYGKIDLPAVQYKSGKKATPVVLQWLLTAHETLESGGAVNAACPDPGPCTNAQEVTKELDSGSFQNAIRQLAQENLGIRGHSKKMYLAFPICRYADEQTMTELTKEAPKWRSFESGISAPPLWTFRNACKYSNTRAAMLFADKYHELDAYARIRGTDADTIRDVYLSDAGIDARGRKSYDLGNQTVIAELQLDLAFLVLKEDGKTAKSLPKKDADPEKYEAANADFSEMKKAVKKIVKNRSRILFEDFISGRDRDAGGWKKAYMNNPLLLRVAKLIVWRQGSSTFTLNDTGAILADGSSYEIGKDPVAVAHPMEMKPEDVTAWQHYFTAKGLKQPFAQIWEPIIDPKAIIEDRYRGCMIPYYRFRGMEKHGIQVEDRDYHNDIEISFAECDATVERIDWNRHNINNDDRFEVTSFSFPKYTRQVNHIAAYLDRVTIYDRILKDDVSVEQFLPGFTLAQITDFTKFATENHCTNVTAMLINYKKKHFPDFDPMDEFILN